MFSSSKGRQSDIYHEGFSGGGSGVAAEAVSAAVERERALRVSASPSTNSSQVLPTTVGVGLHYTRNGDYNNLRSSDIIHHHSGGKLIFFVFFISNSLQMTGERETESGL